MQVKPPTFDARPDPGESGGGSRERDTRRRDGRAQTTLDFAVGMSVFLLTVAFVLSFTPNIVAPFSESGTEDTVTANRVASQLVEGTLADPDRPYVLDKACTTAFFAPENSDGDIDGNDLNDANDDQLEPNGRASSEARYDISTDDDVDGSGCNFDLVYLHQRLGTAGIGDDGTIDRSLSPGLQIEIRGDANDDGTPHLLCIDANGDSSGDPWEDEDPDVENRIVEAPDDDPWNTGDPCDASSDDYDTPFVVGEDPPENSGSVVVARRIVTIDGIRATVYVRVW
jgi:hypothetical protein